MFTFKKLRAWLSRRKPPPQSAPEIIPAVERDMGIKISRIRLPSGGEIVLVEKVHDASDS